MIEAESTLIPRLKHFLILLLCGMLVFVFPRFMPGVFEPFFQFALVLIFSLVSLFIRKNGGYIRYFPVSYAFLMASTVTFMNNAIYVFELTNVSTVSGIFFAQVISTLMTIVPILILTKASGVDYESIYLQSGKLKLGLIIGLGSFLFFLLLTSAIPRGASMLFPVNPELSDDNLRTLLVWVVPFVLLNGFKEELWFRGIFLKPYGEFLGSGLANFLQAFIFSVTHMSVEYTPVILGFLFITFLLALIWGFIVQRTNSIIGASLFHATMDIAIALGIFSNML